VLNPSPPHRDGPDRSDTEPGQNTSTVKNENTDMIHVLPLSPITENMSAARALVVLVDPEQQPEPPTQPLRRTYGLANVAADVSAAASKASAAPSDAAVREQDIRCHTRVVKDGLNASADWAKASAELVPIGPCRSNKVAPPVATPAVP
jgi:hypothetical protein